MLRDAATSGTPPVLEHDGAAALGVALRRLATTKRVLMIAAHPDDENTALLAELALGDGADVAYLSLTRGEGGQNLIGPELQEGLGLIRTEELLSARRLDGAHQFFTRAFDFGFSRSAEETFQHWPRDSILGDVVEVIRRYRPDIVVSVFSGTPADGHGHHQAAGILAREAFDAAADPARYPEHAARGLPPHRAHYLYQSHWRPPADPEFTVAAGNYDPLFGRSRYQIAMQSRSRHRSQDMGQAETAGPQSVALSLLAGDHPGRRAVTETGDGPAGSAGRAPGNVGPSLFAALDTTLSQRARTAGASAPILRLLELYEAGIHEAREAFNPLRPAETGRALVSLHQHLLRVAVTAELPALEFHLAEEIVRLEHAYRLAGGFVLDAVADTPFPVPGESFTLTISAWNGSPRISSTLDRLKPLLPSGWSYTALEDEPVGRRLAPGELLQRRFRVHVPEDAAPSEPYFLRQPRPGSLYAWAVDDTHRAAAFEPREVRAVAHIGFGAAVRPTWDAEFVTVDKSFGELRQPLLVVPAVSVTAEPGVAVIPAHDAARSRTYTVTVSSAAGTPVRGTAHLDAPAGWRVEPASVPLVLESRGASATALFQVTPPASAGAPPASTVAELRARFESDRGTFDRGYSVIDYPHIEPRALYRDATVRVTTFPVRIADNLRVGWIEGAGDDAGNALRQLGATVETLDAAALANADLSRYDAIITGIRAYEVRPDLIAHNDRLLAYARAGGTFVVQYNKYELVDDGGFMPFPATMSRPHGRITQPDAPVTLLDPDHPLLAGPNRITAADFDGWVQERGLYYLDTFDDRYTPLLAMQDPGEPVQHGALVAARVGDGWYVYTGLALFRQLPEGVPGAYRLLANLVSLGR